MCRGDRRDHGHVKAGKPCQRANFAGVIHADLDHREIGVGGHPGKGQRHAPVVVVAGFGGMDPALTGEGHTQHFLGRCLADRPGDPDDPRAGPVAGGGAQSLKGVQNIGHHQQRRIGRNTGGPA